MKLNDNTSQRTLKLPVVALGICGMLAGLVFIFLGLTNTLTGRTPFLIGALFIFSSASSVAHWLWLSKWLLNRGSKPKK